MVEALDTSYSLLESHDDVAVYRAPDPRSDSTAWVEIGLYSWELGENDGIGIRADYHSESSHYPKPSGQRHRVKEAYDVFSNGYGDGGQTFRVQNATSNDLRQLGRWLSLHAFSYWWWLETHTEHPLGMKGTREQMRRPRIDDVRYDGSVHPKDGEVVEGPYHLDDIELIPPSEWQSPEEIAEERVSSVVSELEDDIPYHVLRRVLRSASESLNKDIEKTPEKEQRDRLKDAIRDADNIGTVRKTAILKEFDSLADLCEDIREGSERLLSVRSINESCEDTIINALVESGSWIAEEDDER